MPHISKLYVLLGFFLLHACAGPEPFEPTAAPAADRGPVGKADLVGSCEAAAGTCVASSAVCPDDGIETADACSASEKCCKACPEQFPWVTLVDAAAPAGGDGACWSSAYRNLQTALTAANPGDEIWVAGGTYQPGVAPEDSFELRGGVSLYGGFAGDETARSQRAPSTFESVLSGDMGAARTDHLVTASAAVQADTVMDGFTLTRSGGSGLLVTGGSPTVASCSFIAHEGSAVAIDGGGEPTLRDSFFDSNGRHFANCIHLRSGKALVTGSTFSKYRQCVALEAGTSIEVQDSAFKGGGITSWGGALRVVDAAATVSGTTFEGNSATYDGGAIYSIRSSLVVRDATFANNTAWDNGGAIWQKEGSVEVDGCAFDANGAGSGSGGAIYAQDASGVIEHSTFHKGRAGYGGGALGLRASPNLTITDCAFSDNGAKVAGGAIYAQFNGFTDIRDATFERNTSGYGGALYVQTGATTLVRATFRANVAKGGGAVNSIGSTTFDAVNVVFNGNSASSGGGALDISGGTVVLANARFSDNRAGPAGGRASGGAMKLYQWDQATIVNSTFAGNTSPAGGAIELRHYMANSKLTLANSVMWGNAPRDVITYGPELTVTHSCVQDELAGESNILLRSSPFVDADGADTAAGNADDNLHLTNNGCANSADEAALPADTFDLNANGDATENLPFDLSGRARVSGQLDRGAYESHW